jgi:hypothetical protein
VATVSTGLPFLSFLLLFSFFVPFPGFPQKNFAEAQQQFHHLFERQRYTLNQRIFGPKNGEHFRIL